MHIRNLRSLSLKQYINIIGNRKGPKIWTQWPFLILICIFVSYKLPRLNMVRELEHPFNFIYVNKTGTKIVVKFSSSCCYDHFMKSLIPLFTNYPSIE